MDYSKAAQFAAFCFQAHLVMQHMKEQDGSSPWLEIHTDGSGSIKTWEHREPEPQLEFTSFAIGEKGLVTHTKGPFRALQDYMVTMDTGNMVVASELVSYLQEMAERATDIAEDLNYVSEASWYAGRAKAFTDVMGFLASCGVSVNDKQV